MKFVLVQAIAILAGLAAAGPVPDASPEVCSLASSRSHPNCSGQNFATDDLQAASASWVDVARTLKSDPNAVVDVTPEGKFVSLVDGRVIDSVQLSEQQTTEALTTLGKATAKRAERRSSVPDPAESVGLTERQIYCRNRRCYSQSDCTIFIECYLCASDGYCY